MARRAGPLRNRTVVACSTANSRTGETFSKFRCRAIHTKTGDAVQLSPAETSESYASSSYEVDGVGVESDGEVVLGSTRGRFLVRGPNPDRKLFKGGPDEAERRRPIK